MQHLDCEAVDLLQVEFLDKNALAEFVVKCHMLKGEARLEDLHRARA